MLRKNVRHFGPLSIIATLVIEMTCHARTRALTHIISFAKNTEDIYHARSGGRGRFF